MEFDTKSVTFSGASDLAVIGYDIESADYTNRRGEIYGYRPYVFATDKLGNRKHFYLEGASRNYGYRVDGRALAEADKRAENMARYFNERFTIAGKLPLRWNEFQDCRPEYGSEAYIAYGQYDDLELERREEEESYW